MRSMLFAILTIFLMALGCSCSQLPGLPRATLAGSSHLLTIEQVSESDSSGQFIVAGKTKLPEQTRLTISAVRELMVSSQDETRENAVIYGILDRRNAVVEDGRWQAKMVLWVADPNGYYRENWQINNSLMKQQIKPNQKVDFLLTVEPVEFSRAVSKALPQRLEDEAALLYFTPEGEPYLRVVKALSLPIPDNIKSFSAESFQEDKSPWEGRAIVDNTKGSIEQIPITPFLESDNLFISPDHMMN